MFSYLEQQFTGVAEMLAPVGGPHQQLFLAIQHQRNEEARNLIFNSGLDVSRNSESGYGAIHMACKFNNRTVFDMLISRGISMESLDANGNSPLHYAARAGSIDICKLLIENGCNPARRNSHQQTPYDYSQNHVVRQYLLPIQLKAEAGSQPAQMGISSDASYGYKYADPAPSMAPPGVNGGMQQPSYQPHPQPEPSQQPIMQPPPPMNMAVAPSSGQVDTTAGMQTIDLSSPPQQQQHPAADTKIGFSQPVSSSALKFKPDGFHTSASDPALQQKYGHRREIGVVQQNGNLVVGPPPSGPVFSSPAPAHSGGTPMSVFQRYVAVDYATNTPLAAPAPGAYGSNAPPQGGAMNNMMPTVAATGPSVSAANAQAQIFLPPQQQQQQQQQHQQFMQQPPAAVPAAPPAAPGITAPTAPTQAAGAPQLGGGLAGGGMSRQGGFGPPQVQIFSKPSSQSSLSPTGSGKHSQDSGNAEVIALGSHSNSVM